MGKYLVLALLALGAVGLFIFLRDKRSEDMRMDLASAAESVQKRAGGLVEEASHVASRAASRAGEMTEHMAEAAGRATGHANDAIRKQI